MGKGGDNDFRCQCKPHTLGDKLEDKTMLVILAVAIEILPGRNLPSLLDPDVKIPLFRLHFRDNQKVIDRHLSPAIRHLSLKSRDGGRGYK